MLVVMQAHATEEQVRAVCQKVEALGYRAHPMPGATRTAIGITGNQGEIEQGTLDEMAGVQEVIRVSKPYKLVSRDVKEKTRSSSLPGRRPRSGGRTWRSLRGPARLRVGNKRSRWRSECIGRALSSSAAVLTSRVPHPTPFKGSPKKDCGSWRRSANSSA